MKNKLLSQLSFIEVLDFAVPQALFSISSKCLHTDNIKELYLISEAANIFVEISSNGGDYSHLCADTSELGICAAIRFLNGYCLEVDTEMALYFQEECYKLICSNRRDSLIWVEFFDLLRHCIFPLNRFL